MNITTLLGYNLRPPNPTRDTVYMYVEDAVIPLSTMQTPKLDANSSGQTYLGTCDSECRDIKPPRFVEQTHARDRLTLRLLSDTARAC